MSELPEGWTSASIGSVTTKAEKWDPRNSPGSFTYIDIASVDATSKSVIAPQQVHGPKAPSRARQVTREGDVLVSTVRPNLNAVAHVSAPLDGATASTGFSVLRPGPEISSRYLYHWVQSRPFIAQIERLATGQSYPAVSDKVVGGSTIPLPPLPEQRRIAAILDKGIILQELTLKRKERTDSLLNQVFIKWFPKNQHLSAPLASLGTVTTGKTPPTNDATSFGGPIPFTTPGDLLEKTPARWLSEDGAQKSRVVRSGSALVCCIGATIGKVGIARQPTAFNQQINAVEWGDSIDDAYGYFALRARSRHIAALGESTTMPILNKGQFSKLTIPVPPISKQRKFREFFDTWEKQQTSHEAQLQTLEALARSLPSRAFRGEL